MDKRFAGLKAFQSVRIYTFYFGLCLGSFLIVLAMLGVAYLYRVKKFGGWKSKKATREFSTTMIQKIDEYKTLRATREFK